ncbi:DUF4124 domain-containing protein [Thiocystis violascens]|uniref:DUF4124 domain-containing protein n=1 Tax=Thiocystis violascens TaxID=73141 RepID=UPI0009FCE4A9
MRTLALLLALLVTLDPCAASQLFRWIDDQGQVHFSDRPPSNPAAPVQVQPLPPPAPRPADNHYSVMNQVKRLESERQQREAARWAERVTRQEEELRLAEIEESRARARLAEAEAERARQSVYLVYPRFRKPPRPGPDHRPNRSDHLPRHSDTRPVQPDGRSVTRPGRSSTVPGRSLHSEQSPPRPRH